MTFFYDLNKRLASIADKPETKQLNEGTVAETSYSATAARAGKDIGKPGKQFAKIAKSAAERYGSKERGEKVAGAVLAKLRKGGVKEEYGPLEEKDVGEGNAFAKAVIDAKKDGIQPGEKIHVGGKEYPVKEADMDESALQAYLGKKKYGKEGMAALQKAGREGASKEKMAKIRAQHDKMDEGWDDMLKDVEKRRQMKPGDKMQGAKGEIEKTATGIKHTRRYDPKSGETDSGDDVAATGEKRGRGRPKGSGKKIGAKGPGVKSKLLTREDDNMTDEVRQAMATLKKAGYRVTKAAEELDEKAVSRDQAIAARIARGVQKGEVKAKKGSASAEMAKMEPKELKKFAKTDTKGLPKKVSKKKEEVEETTVSGSVAPAPEAPKSKSKGGVQFGKGIYDSMNRELEQMIAESMNISMNMSNDEHGGPSKSLTVTATDEDAVYLGKLLKMAGLGGSEGSGCGCGQSPCACNSAEQVDENSPDWPTNTETSDDALQYSGGLNKPKTTVAGDGQTTVPVTAVQVREGQAEQGMAGDSLDRILARYPKEVENFKQGGDLGYDLESDLWDYYFSHGDIKNYDADASEFISQRLADYLGINEQGVAEGSYDNAMAGLQRTIDFAKQHGYKIYRSPTGRKMRFVNKELEHEIRAEVDNDGHSINVNFMDYSSGVSGNDDASYFDKVFKDAYKEELKNHQYRSTLADYDYDDDDEYTASQPRLKKQKDMAEGSLEEVSLALAKRARDKAEHHVDWDEDDLRDRPEGYSEKQRSKFQRYIDRKEPRAPGDRDWDPPQKGVAEGSTIDEQEQVMAPESQGQELDEEIKRIREMAGIREAAKPDYIDLDKDGNRKESMKKAAADAEKDKKVEESILSMTNLWKQYKG